MHNSLDKVGKMCERHFVVDVVLCHMNSATAVVLLPPNVHILW